MNKKYLKYPFAWEERKPLIKDRIFYVPNHLEFQGEWKFPLWSDPLVFERVAPIWIEYCSGNGEWILEKAKAHPEWNWVAVEKRFARVKQIYAKREACQLNNLFIICGEALNFTRQYVASESFEGAYINFPDPWPKGRHAKHRLFQDPFILELARSLKSEACVTVVTDHSDYATNIAQLMQRHPEWKNVFPAPYYITEWEGEYGASFFDTLWRKIGRTIHYLQYSKASCPLLNTLQ
jgi:tRNA (guanine-N7-)-methyltransferase